MPNRFELVITWRQIIRIVVWSILIVSTFFMGESVYDAFPEDHPIRNLYGLIMNEERYTMPADQCPAKGFYLSMYVTDTLMTITLVAAIVRFFPFLVSRRNRSQKAVTKIVQRGEKFSQVTQTHIPKPDVKEVRSARAQVNKMSLLAQSKEMTLRRSITTMQENVLALRNKVRNENYSDIRHDIETTRDACKELKSQNEMLIQRIDEMKLDDEK